MTKTTEAKGRARLIPHDEVFAEWRKDPAYCAAYDAFKDEFLIMSALIKARAESGLISFLRSPEAVTIIKAKGLDPGK